MFIFVYQWSHFISFSSNSEVEDEFLASMFLLSRLVAKEITFTSFMSLNNQ